MSPITVVLEPASSETYSISYTCLLIPRSPAHLLDSQLAHDLADWLAKICEAKDWHVEFLTVDSRYFQWGLRVVSSIQTGQFMKEIRSKTSELALAKHADLQGKEEPADFWAPGYLVVLGTRPHPQEMIEYYIHLVRRQQGFTP